MKPIIALREILRSTALGVTGLLACALIPGLAAEPSENSTTVGGPTVTSELKWLIESLASDRRTTWAELQTLVHLSPAEPSANTYPKSYFADGVTEGPLGIAMKVRVSRIPPDDPREIPAVRLTLDTTPGSGQCADFETVREWLGYPLMPPIPGHPGTPWGKVAEGNLHGVEIKVAAYEQAFPCIGTVFLGFPARYQDVGT